jgi:hypothetical protein
MAEPIELPQRHYVYVLYHDTDMGRPFYVGMGSGKRLQYHHGERWHRGLRGEIIRELKRTLGFIPSQKVAEGLTKAAAYALEIELIKQFGRIPNGPLTNLTDGGEGSNKPQGIPCAPEARVKISASLTGKKQSLETIAKRAAASSIAQRGKKRGRQSPETQAKRSAALKMYRAALKAGGGVHPAMHGKKHSLETRAKMSTTAKRNGNKPPREKLRALKASPETKQKMSAAQVRRWARIPKDQRQVSPEAIQNMKAAVRPPISEETRRKLREAAKLQWERQNG